MSRAEQLALVRDVRVLASYISMEVSSHCDLSKEAKRLEWDVDRIADRFGAVLARDSRNRPRRSKK